MFLAENGGESLIFLFLNDLFLLKTDLSIDPSGYSPLGPDIKGFIKLFKPSPRPARLGPLVDVKQPLISALIIPSLVPGPLSGLVSNIQYDIAHTSNHNHFYNFTLIVPTLIIPRRLVSILRI